ncbi:MAG: shikimate dehydrogenase [Bacteroidales bacterium]|nr:shikimate dehydrogenase [Bacteroidales bacterium]
MKLYGLIGKSLTHSFSLSYFKEKFIKEGIEDAYYNLYPLQTIDEFNQLITDSSELSGLNVTIPYKTEVIPFLDYLDNAAKEIGAVNTIKFNRENSKLKLYGYNTDCLGFWESLKPILNENHKKALILGTGGSSKAVSYSLRKANIQCLFASRNPIQENSISYDQINEQILQDYTIIINTSPLGMFPETDKYPNIPYKLVSSKHILYDLIYNPNQTVFLKKGQEQGAVIKNGLEMLKIQANYSWKIWNT